MKISLTSSRAGNWVDRGEQATPHIARTLAFFFDYHAASDESWLTHAAQTLVGMVAADASEVLVAGYLKHLAQERGVPFPARARLASSAVWHIAKAALVRDAAVRLLNSELPGEGDAVRPPLSAWLAERLLTPDELAAHAAEQGAPPRGDTP